MAYYVICDDDCKYEGMTKEQILSAIEQGLAQGYVSDPDSAVFSKIKEICANAATQIWVGTEAQFNAISPAPAVGKSVVRVGTDGVMYLCSDDSTLNDLSEHLSNKDNPHGVTFNQVVGGNTVPVSKGGTGASDAATARTNLGITPANIGAAAASHTHSLSSLGAAAASHDHNLQDLSGTVPLSKGGTGKTTAAGISKLVNTPAANVATSADPLALANGVYSVEGTVSTANNWPVDAWISGTLEVYGTRNTSVSDGYDNGQYRFRLTTQDGDVYINARSWRVFTGWKKILNNADTKPTLSSTTAVERTQYFNVGNALVQSGITDEVSCASGSVTSYTVTFPKAFSSGCVVMASLYYNNDTSSDAAAVNVAAGSYSSSQLVIKFSNTSGGARSLRASWLAIGM